MGSRILLYYFNNNTRGRFRIRRAVFFVAFALTITREKADELVGKLNEITDCWFLGDENEEYVFID